MALGQERTILTERPLLVGEVSADRRMTHNQYGGSPMTVISVF
jgi:hypothetical protein